MARGSAQSALPGVGGDAWYNDNDAFCAAWLRHLVAAGHISAGLVDERSIGDVAAADLGGYRHCHFFAGIGGWPYALQLAGWPTDRPVWTGSCPCQPFSSAGRQGGAADERHLWPRWFRLIRECRPDTILGEQVEGAVGFGWIDRVFADLEAEGYACGAAVLGAHSVGAPHIRQRLFWVAHSERAGVWSDCRDDAGEAREVQGEVGQWERLRSDTGAGSSILRGLAESGEPRHQSDARGLGSRERPKNGAGHSFAEVSFNHGATGGGDADAARPQGCQRSSDMELHRGTGAVRSVGTAVSPWVDAVWLPCLDGKARRVVAALQPLAHARECICGLRLGELCTCGQERPSRGGMLRGSGNAIAPAAAAQFIRAVMG